MNTRDSNKVDLSDRVRELESAIEEHFTESAGQNQCWINDEKLWKVLNDGKIRTYPHSETPSYDEMLIECRKYCASRQTGNHIVPEHGVFAHESDLSWESFKDAIREYGEYVNDKERTK